MGHRWNFAHKRTILTPTQVTPSAVDDNTTFQLTKTSHGLSTGNRITVTASTNYPTVTGTWRVTVTASDTFDLDDSDFDGSGAVDFTYALAGAWDWDYSIALPSDCLRALEDDRREANIDIGWEIEAGRVLTDESELEFQYIYSVTDVTLFPPLFISVLVLTLAIKLKVALQGEGADLRGLAAELVSLTAPQAKRIDANESQKRERLYPMQSLFVAARAAGE